jgi:cell division protein FtsN
MLHVLEGEARKGYYSLATSETVNEKKLESMLKKLEKTNLMLAVREETKEKDVFRLIADCYSDRPTAEKRLAEISRRSIKAFISHAGDTFCVVAGSLMSEDAALKEQKRLAGKNLPARIVKVKVPLTVFGLNIGRFSQLQEAEEAAKSIAAQGIDVTVVKIRSATQLPSTAR